MLQSNIFLGSSFFLFLPLLSLKSSLTQILPNHFASPQRASCGFAQELGLLFPSTFTFSLNCEVILTRTIAHSTKRTQGYGKLLT